MAADPNSVDAATTSLQPWATWKRLSTWYDFYQPLTALAALILGAIFAWSLYRTYASTLKYSLDIEKFTYEGVKFDPEFDPNNSLVAEMERGLSRLQKTSPHKGFGLVDGALTDISLDIDLAPIPKQLGALLKFFQYFIPKKQLVLSGHLGFDPSNGATLTMRLIRQESRAKGIETLRRFTQKEFTAGVVGEKPNLSAFIDLIEAATAWIFWEVYELDRDKTSAQRELRDAFGTSEWRSYAFSHRAARYIAIQEYGYGRKKLKDALNLDPNNRSALYNMIFLDYLEISKDVQPASNLELRKHYSELIQDLGNLIYLYEGYARASAPSDIVHVYALYLKGVIYLYQVYPGVPDDEREKYLDYAKHDLDKALTAYQDLSGPRSPTSTSSTSTDSVFAYIKITQLKAEALFANSDADTWKQISEFELIHSHSTNVLYNLACYYSQLACETTFVWADPTAESPDPLLAPSPQSPPGNRENALAQALTLLKSVLDQNPGRADSARGDPSLRCLITSDIFNYKIWGLLGPAEKRSLSDLPADLLSREGIEALAELKIKSLEDLLAYGDTYEKRRQLANKLRLWSDRITLLVKMADLLRIPEIEPDQARLLAEGDYCTIEKLVKPDSGDPELNLDLRALGVRTQLAELDPEIEPPSIQEIKVWLLRGKVLEIKLRL